MLFHTIEKEEKRKAEYDMNTKAMMAPPKALDEEDINHLNSIQERYDADKRRQQEEEDRELEKFRASRFGTAAPVDQNAPLSSSSSSFTSSSKETDFIIPMKAKISVSSMKPSVVVTKKRKINNNGSGKNADTTKGEDDSNDHNDGSNVLNNNDNSSSTNKSAKNDNDSGKGDNNVDDSRLKAPTSSCLSGLGGYGSDSD